MGCDIHSFAEVRKNGRWEKVGDVFPLDDLEKEYYKQDFGDAPFNWRDYNLFGWLADVRNESCFPAISQPRGLPDGLSSEVVEVINEWQSAGAGHSYSWLSLSELLEVNYDVTCMHKNDSKPVSLREHLSEGYFNVLNILKAIGDPNDVRIVFWFDE